MKPIVILTLTAAIVVAVIAHRHRDLSALKEETRGLERQVAGPISYLRPEQEESRKDATAEEVKLVRETMAEVLTSQNHLGTRQMLDSERGKRFLLAARNLSARDIGRLMSDLQSDPRMSGIGREQIILACHELFGDIAPFSWREHLAAHRDFPEWQNFFDAACRSCLREDGKRALALIEQEAARGNPAVATTAIRSSVLLELAVSDPDKMLERAASPELAADPDALFKLGGFVDDKFDSPADHRQFLAALRRAQEKNPSPLLTTIREDYTREMAGQLGGWPAADAITLIDSEFTLEERFSVAEQSASHIDLTDPDAWVDWYLKIDPAAWSEWANRQENRSKHPLIRQIESRAIKDSQTPRGWLEKIPPGPLHDQATLAYCWMIADRDPDLAAGYLDKLPASKGRQNLVRKIEAARR